MNDRIDAVLVDTSVYHMWDYRDMAEDWDDSCDEEEDYDDCEDDYDEEEDY